MSAQFSEDIIHILFAIAGHRRRDGRSVRRGQCILEGVAFEIPYKKLAREPQLSVWTVNSRLKAMRAVYKAEIEEFGMSEWSGEGEIGSTISRLFRVQTALSRRERFSRLADFLHRHLT